MPVYSAADLPPHLFSPAELAAARLPVAQASTLPPACYISPEFYALECERLFFKQWLCVGRIDQLESPGDYFTIDLLGERLVIVRDSQQQIRAMSRVCRHRAMSVVEGAGNRSSFRCPYHLWTYSLSGELVGAPAMQEAVDFHRESCRLPALATEIWQGFIFVNFEPSAAPLAPALQSLDRKLAAYRLSELKTTLPLVYSAPWNWKLMMENFIEYYHHAGTHPQTVERWFPTRLGKIDESDGPYTFSRAAPGPEQDPSALPFPLLPGLSAEQQIERQFGAIFPLHFFGVSPVGMVYYQILPEGAEHLTLRIFPCLPEETLRDPQHAAAVAQQRKYIDDFIQEDFKTCSIVQRGYHSRSARPGRISHLETGVWRFNQHLLDVLLGDDR